MKQLDKPWVIPLIWVMFSGYLVHPLIFPPTKVLVSDGGRLPVQRQIRTALPEKYQDLESLRDPFGKGEGVSGNRNAGVAARTVVGPWYQQSLWGLGNLTDAVTRIRRALPETVTLTDLPPILTATRRERGEPLDVKGVISTGGKKLVFMANQILAEGDAVGDYTLQSIKDDRIVLVKDAGRTVLVRPLRFTNLPAGASKGSGGSSR